MNALKDHQADHHHHHSPASQMLRANLFFKAHASIPWDMPSHTACIPFSLQFQLQSASPSEGEAWTGTAVAGAHGGMHTGAAGPSAAGYPD
eukprot:1158731-Pelagomonas_calceolata.AAC.7